MMRDPAMYAPGVLCDRLRKQIALWQGKFALVKNENNRLRIKIRRLERLSMQSPSVIRAELTQDGAFDFLRVTLNPDGSTTTEKI